MVRQEPFSVLGHCCYPQFFWSFIRGSSRGVVAIPLAVVLQERLVCKGIVFVYGCSSSGAVFGVVPQERLSLSGHRIRFAGSSSGVAPAVVLQESLSFIGA